MPMSRPLLLALLPALGALVLSGCGGGGGGGRAGNSLAYQTTWNGSGAGPIGVSQRITITPVGGTPLPSFILDRDGNVNGHTFTGLTAGSYLVTVELATAAGFGGVKTGGTSTVVQVSGHSTFATLLGPVPTHIDVNPTIATVTQGTSQQFAATPLDAANVAVFVEPNSFTWQSLGGIGTVSDTGTFTATTPGSGSVVAKYVPQNFTDAASITVTPFTPLHTKWTVLVYMNAANDLDTFGDLNINQMEKAAGNPDVRFVVQWKQAVITGESESPSFVGTRRYLLQHDTDVNNVHSQLVQDMGTGVDMGDWHTLNDFISWGKTFYPSDRTVLVIWNHGNGWHRGINTDATRGVSYDDDMGTSIQTWELGQAIGTNHVNIFAWDASLMQMLECNNEIRDKTDLIVGSEESPPGAGYPYDTIFQHFADNPDATTVSLAKNFVDETLLVPSYASQKITQSVIEADKLSDLSNAVNLLASTLNQEEIANRTDFDLYIQTARLNAQAYSQSSSRTYRDLIGLTQELDKTVGAYTPTGGILTGDATVRTAAAAAILYEGHNANSPNSHGIAIDFSPKSRFVNYGSDYSLLRLAQDTEWDEFLAAAP